MTDHTLSAVILAAGQGTRMKSSTPKVLHEVLGRALVGHVVENARQADASRLCVIVGFAREQVEAHLRAHHGGEDLSFAHQAEQKGTGHATLMARPHLAEATGRTIVLAGDVPSLSAGTIKAFVAHANGSDAAVCVMTTLVDDPTGYGRIVRDAEGALLANVEHKDASALEREIREINSGVYLFENTFLWDNLDQIGSTNAQGEYYLPDLIAMAVESGAGASAWIAPDPREIEGVNTRVQLARAESFGRARHNEALMLAGVTMIDPGSTWVDLGVVLEQDVLLEPSVRLTSGTRIASGCVVGQGSIIDDSVLEADVLVKPYSHLESAIVRKGAQIGPFAHLRPQADIGPSAKVGNFVEIKKSTLGPGAKASHLTYIGDATVGANCNIGAGTITCNYDGINKHRTILGDGVFTGSNSALVAPVEVGDNAFIGAGSIITSDVPADALAVGRARQRNLEGWVPKFKRRRGKS